MPVFSVFFPKASRALMVSIDPYQGKHCAWYLEKAQKIPVNLAPGQDCKKPAQTHPEGRGCEEFKNPHPKGA